MVVTKGVGGTTLTMVRRLHRIQGRPGMEPNKLPRLTAPWLGSLRIQPWGEEATRRNRTAAEEEGRGGTAARNCRRALRLRLAATPLRRLRSTPAGFQRMELPQTTTAPILTPLQQRRLPRPTPPPRLPRQGAALTAATASTPPPHPRTVAVPRPCRPRSAARTKQAPCTAVALPRAACRPAQPPSRVEERASAPQLTTPLRCPPRAVHRSETPLTTLSRTLPWPSRATLRRRPTSKARTRATSATRPW